MNEDNPTHTHADTNARATHITGTASAAFVLRSAMHTLFYINSGCKHACQFSDDHTIVFLCICAIHIGLVDVKGSIYSG